MPRTLKLAGMQIALAAMLLRALLPAGWMPNPDGGTAAPFVVCTINGPVHIAADSHPGKPARDDGRQNDICPFAASVHLATPPSAATLVPSVSVAELVPEFIAPAAVAIGARHTPQSPRAPPSLV